jgi:hypothetical protein
LNLSLYTGNTQFVGDHTQTGAMTVTGLSTLNDLSFSLGADVTWTNSNSTGTQLFDTNYVGTYDNSTINYTNGTTVNQDATSIYNNSGTTNYDATSVVDFADNSTVNIG